MELSGLVIRKETPEDFDQVMDLVAAAFEKDIFTHEPSSSLYNLTLIVNYRYSKYYSLVAVINDLVVGHVLFNPHPVKLYGKVIDSISLTILSVHPDYQKKGIGSLLIKKGIELTSDSYKFCWLFGHESYYPRFGFKTGSIGAGAVVFDRSDFPHMEPSLTESQVLPTDVNSLIELQNQTFQTELSSIPSNRIISWKSSSTLLNSNVLYHDGELIGYIRYTYLSTGLQIKRVLASNTDSFKRIISFMFDKSNDIQQLSVPIHPESPILNGLKFKSDFNACGAGMIKILDSSCEEIARYCEEVQNDSSKVGMIDFPIFFDLC